MKIHHTLALTAISIALASYGSGKINDLDFASSLDTKQVRAEKELRSIIAAHSYDVSNNGRCEFCSTLASSICKKCKRAFYCSRPCQVNDYQKHRKICYDYYDDNLNVMEREKYDDFVNCDEHLNWLQYYTKSKQARYVACYLRKIGEFYQIIIPRDIQNFIFLICYTPPEDKYFQNDFHNSLQIGDFAEPYLKIRNRNPIYLIRFLQYIYEKESSSQVVKHELKKTLLKKIALTYAFLGIYFCFVLQKKLMLAAIRLIKEEDYEILRSIARVEYRGKLAVRGGDPCKTYGHCIFVYLLEKGEKKALEYSSIAGWCTLRKGIEEKLEQKWY